MERGEWAYEVSEESDVDQQRARGRGGRRTSEAEVGIRTGRYFGKRNPDRPVTEADPPGPARQQSV